MSSVPCEASRHFIENGCTKLKLRASTGETQSSHCQRIMPRPRRMTQNVLDAMQQRCSRTFEKALLLMDVMYQSIPSLTIPPGDPRGFGRSHCPGGQVFAQFSLPELDKFFYSFGRKMQEHLHLFRRQLEKQVFLCCFTSIFAKTVDASLITSTIFGHFSHFDKFSGHPRVIFADTRSSLKW